MNKLNALDQLIEALARLVALLVLDPGCQWTLKFQSDLAWARQLKSGPVNTSDLADLSSSIRHVFGGMGSFNDYAPAVYAPTTRRYMLLPGTEDFDTARSDVFDLALALVVAEP